MYGPTETSVWSAIRPVTAEQAVGIATIGLGQPIANTQIYVLDTHGEPVPVGVTGEIHIGGAGVARGYLNRPDLTAERFLPDPFSDRPGARLYRTGDLGRWRPDGTLDYLGRNDFQVKLRGFRIELGEIETALVACPGIRDAVVLAREDLPGDTRLVAYAVADDDLDLAALRQALARTLPDYMIPSAFVRLDAFPLTGNGKLDRHALPAPDQQAVIARAFVAPEGPDEVLLAQLWQELLGLDRVGRHDHFFELGGHSLLFVELLEKLRSVGKQLDTRAAFAQPTVAGFARVLTDASNDAYAVPENLIPDVRHLADRSVTTPDMEEFRL